MTVPKRILHVLGCLDRGGAETLVMNIYRKIDREQLQFDFVVHTNQKGAYFDEIQSLGGKVYVCPRYIGKNHFSYKKWWQVFLSEHTEYKIVHGHVRSTASIYLRVAKKQGRYTIAHSHSTSSGNGVSSIIKKIMQFPIRNIADCFLGCSQQANEWLFGKKVANDHNKCSILKNGIDLAKFDFDLQKRNETRARLGLEGKKVIGTVGRIETPKNPLFIIDIFHELVKNNSNCMLLWVGDGSLAGSVVEKAKMLNIDDKVIMVGSKSNVSDYLQAMDVFLFPSLWEGLGMSLIEAQATGLPCLCSDVIPEEANVSDLLFKISLGSGVDFWVSSCIDMMINKSVNRQSRTQSVTAAGYDIQQIVKQLRGIYENQFITETQN